MMTCDRVLVGRWWRLGKLPSHNFCLKNSTDPYAISKLITTCSYRLCQTANVHNNDLCLINFTAYLFHV